MIGPSRLLRCSPTTASRCATSGPLEITEHTLSGAIDALLAQLGADGYLAVQAYLDRPAHPEFAELRDAWRRVRTGR